MDQSDGLRFRAAVGSRDSGDGKRDTGGGKAQRALGHCFSNLGADGAELIEKIRSDVDAFFLGAVGISDIAAFEDFRRTGNLGDQSGDQTAGTGFGGNELKPRSR